MTEIVNIVKILRYLDSSKSRVVGYSEMSINLSLDKGFLNQTLRRLRKAGFISVKKGPKGGAALSRSIEYLTVEELYPVLRPTARLRNITPISYLA